MLVNDFILEHNGENDTRNMLNRQLLAVSAKAMETLDAVTKKLDKKLMNKLFSHVNTLIKDNVVNKDETMFSK